jgi:prevent-host-death family protein
LVVKKTIHQPVPTARRAKRLNVSEAKSKLSRALRELEDSPTIIHNRGRDVAVLISMENYEQLLAAERSANTPTVSSFLQTIDVLKRKFGGGAVLAAEPMEFVPHVPFARSRR